MAQMAALARDEEAWWQAELARLAPQLLAAGASGARRRARRRFRPRFRAGHRGEPAGGARSGAATAAYPLRGGPIRRGARFFRNRSRAVAGARRPGRPEACSAARPARGEDCPRAAAVDRSRTSSKGKNARRRRPRSMQRGRFPAKSTRRPSGSGCASRLARSATAERLPNGRSGSPAKTATLRNWKPGDRVRLRYSGGPRKVKEVLERMRVTGTDRALWPVLEIDGAIVWMRGVELEPDPGLVSRPNPRTPGPRNARVIADRVTPLTLNILPLSYYGRPSNFHRPGSTIGLLLLRRHGLRVSESWIVIFATLPGAGASKGRWPSARV